MIILQLMVLVLSVGIMPLLIGRTFREYGKSGINIIFDWVRGTLVMLAIYMVLANIITFTGQSLTMLTALWLVGCLAVIVCGHVADIRAVNTGKTNGSEIKRSGIKGNAINRSDIKTSEINSYETNISEISKTGKKLTEVNITCILILVLIAVQIAAVIMLRHTDEDDSWYVATSATDWYTNTVGQFDPYTGEKMSWAEQSDYLMAPWPVFIATLAQLTRIHPTVISHTYIDIYVILLFYAVYYIIGRHFFENDTVKSERFMLVIALLTTFGNFSRRSPANLLLQRGWQGKAVMAAAILPLIFILADKFLRDGSRYNYIMLMSSVITCAMLSSMGTILSSGIIVCFGVAGVIKKVGVYRLIALAMLLLPNICIVAMKFMLIRGIVC